MKPEKEVYRVIQWATGGLGTKAIRAMQEVPYLELVGCWVSSDAKHGRDAGEIAGIAPLGIAASMHLEDICGIDADVVHYSPALPNWDDVCSLLRSGKNVMSPLHFTFLGTDPEARKKVEDAALKGGVSYYGTGIYPDWTAARMVLNTSALCHNIKKITFIEQNARMLKFGSAEHIMFDVLRFGSEEKDAHEASVASIAFYGCLIEELKNVGAAMGYEVERVEMNHEHALAARDIHQEGYERYIKKGTVAGWKSTFTGYIQGKPVLEYSSYHLADAASLDRWEEFSDDASYTAEFDAQPPLKIKFTSLASDDMTAAEGCYESTMMNNLNVIPGLVSANPGIVCSSDMPQLLCSYQRLDLN